MEKKTNIILNVLNISKKIGNAYCGLFINNCLLNDAMKTPKMQFILTHPDNNSSNNTKESLYLDIQETTALIHGLRYNSSQNPIILKSYKGGFDKNLKKVVARIFTVEKKENFIIFRFELTNGIQMEVSKNDGTKVGGIVKPAGGQAISKGSISLTREEALYVSYMLENELIAWRTIVGQRYIENINNNNQVNNNYNNSQVNHNYNQANYDNNYDNNQGYEFDY